jgi:two-component system, OmpR family, sensor histidine kinase BaeS
MATMTGNDLKERVHKVTSAARRRLSPKSLRVQLAAGSALIALGAVLFVTLAAVLSIGVSFNDYRRGQLTEEVSQVAELLGRQQASSTRTVLNSGLGAPPLPAGGLTKQRIAVVNVWIVDAGGRLVVTPPQDPGSGSRFTDDKATIVAALGRALAGHTEEGTLPGSHIPFLTMGMYAVAPIHAGGLASGHITGAVALSTVARIGRALDFAGQVNTTLWLAALVAALLAAGFAAFFSRRLTRPLAGLTAASARMAGGDYAARVKVHAPEELERLGSSFNEMAAALQSDVRKLREQERLRRELVANVSHELATPLTAIQGFTEALLDDVVEDPEARTETTRLIAREAARLKRLVDQLREVTLYDSGAQALQRAPVPLPSLVNETLAVLTPEIEHKAITASTTLADDLPPVLVDGDHLTEILLNLLDNALRHTPEGGRIEVTGTRDGNSVHLSIADSGPGIPPEDRERVFERFYRVDPSRSAATGGSGLGLAIVRSLVEAHGGTIAVDERPGGGARFTLTLPLAHAS